MTITEVNGLIGKTGYLVRKAPRNGFFVRHITGGADQFYSTLEEIAFFWNRAHSL